MENVIIRWLVVRRKIALLKLWKPFLRRSRSNASFTVNTTYPRCWFLFARDSIVFNSKLCCYERGLKISRTILTRRNKNYGTVYNTAPTDNCYWKKFIAKWRTQTYRATYTNLNTHDLLFELQLFLYCTSRSTIFRNCSKWTPLVRNQPSKRLIVDPILTKASPGIVRIR